MSDAVELIRALGGESVTYVPYGGTAKTFLAIIERQPSGVQGTVAGNYPVNEIDVLIPRDATDGVLTVQPRKDRIRFRWHVIDREFQEFLVQKIVQEDEGLGGSGGMFRVTVQA